MVAFETAQPSYCTLRLRQCQPLAQGCPDPTGPKWSAYWGAPAAHTRVREAVGAAESVEWPGGLSPPGSPRTVREPLDSYGSRCSAVSMTQLPVSEELRICTTQLRKPVSRPLGAFFHDRMSENRGCRGAVTGKVG